MKDTERIKMVKAMEFIVRNLNDESIFESWLLGGVADGDIEYSDTVYKPEDIEELEYYIRDNEFSELMSLFISCIKDSYKSGGLYCDGVVSK